MKKKVNIEKKIASKRAKDIKDANEEVVSKFGEEGLEKFKAPEGK